jgi:hypothetical protein
MSGETVTLNFLKKSMPRMGPATAACKKPGCKKFALELYSFFNETLRGDRLPIYPFEKGTRWAGILLQGTMLNVAQYEPNTCHLSIRQLRKSDRHWQENA